jgi:phosphoribosyl-AMP cyclohydrolase
MERLDEAIRFNEEGLIPVIAQDATSGEVLMLAWMNSDALKKTRTTGEMVYWSRSRNALWRKGESSGQTQKVVSLALDCDGDTLLATVNQTGVACHTGRKNCFFNEIKEDGSLDERFAPEIDPKELYDT